MSSAGPSHDRLIPAFTCTGPSSIIAMSVAAAESTHGVIVDPIDVGSEIVAARCGLRRRPVVDRTQWRVVAERRRSNGRIKAGVVHESEWTEVQNTYLAGNGHVGLLDD